MVSNLRSLQAGPCVRIPRQERIRLNGGGGEQGDLPGKMVLGKLPGRQFGMKGRGGEGGVRRLAGVAELHGDNGGGLASLRARMLGGTDAETDPWQGSWPTDSDGGSVAHAGYPASEARDPWGLSKTDGRSTSSRKAGLAISATEADKGEGAGRGGVVPIAGLLQLASPSKHEADSYDQSYTTSDDSLEFSGVHRLVAVEGVRGGLLGKIRRRLGVGVDRRRSLLVSRQKQKLSASMCKECADWLKVRAVCDKVDARVFDFCISICECALLCSVRYIILTSRSRVLLTLILLRCVHWRARGLKRQRPRVVSLDGRHWGRFPRPGFDDFASMCSIYHLQVVFLQLEPADAM